jgi:hypothetical protein
MTDPIFMSAEHVEIMNRRLAASEEVAAVAAQMPRSYEVAYRLRDEKADRTEFWLMQLGPSGVRFALEPSESADLTFVGDYQRMIDSSRASRGGETADPGLEVLGDPTVLESIAEVFAAAQKVGAVPVSWPE